MTYFRDATQADNTDSDLFFNLGYAYWLQKDLTNAINWLRETVRRNPADDAAHYVLGVALQASGSPTEAASEKELAKRLSSDYAEWDAKQAGRNDVPRGLERIKTDVDVRFASRARSWPWSSGTSATWPGSISTPGGAPIRPSATARPFRR